MNTQKPFIILLSMYKLHIGGIETNLLQIATHLRHKFDMMIVAPVSPAFINRAKTVGVNIQPLGFVSKFNFFYIFRLFTLFRSLKADVVHTQDPRGGMLGRIAAKLSGAKVIHTVHMAPFFQTNSPLMKCVYSVAESVLNNYFTDKIIFVSKSIQDIYFARGLASPAKALHIPNGIVLDSIKEILQRRSSFRQYWRSRLGVSEQEYIISWVGRITKQKGLDYLVNAAANLQHHPIKYLIIGDGPERASLEDLVEKKGLGGHFIFLGFKDQQEVYQLLVASDLFVLPSRYECLPYALLEAMALGLPCIATDVGGNREIISNGVNGYLVPAGDVHGLEVSIERLVCEPILREEFSQKAISWVAKFEVRNVLERIEAVYRSVVGNISE